MNLGVNLEGMQIVDPLTSRDHREAYILELFRLAPAARRHSAAKPRH